MMMPWDLPKLSFGSGLLSSVAAAPVDDAAAGPEDVLDGEDVVEAEEMNGLASD